MRRLLTRKLRPLTQMTYGSRQSSLRSGIGSKKAEHPAGGELDETATDVEDGEAPREFDIDVGPAPERLEDAACSCSFQVRSAIRRYSPDLPRALRARLVLRRAGIPCYLTVQQDQMRIRMTQRR